MNRLFILLIFILFTMFGCKNKELDEKYLSQIINKLDMNIFTNDGEKLLNIESPHSNYDKEDNTFNLKKTTINLFKDNKIEYIINSDKSKISNNNKLIELNGNVLVRTIIQKDDKLTANSFIWDIQKSEYLLVGDVYLENGSVTLSSNKAILNKNNNIIKFFKPVKYKFNDNVNQQGYEVNSENAYYNINTKSVNFTSKEKRIRSKIFF